MLARPEQRVPGWIWPALLPVLVLGGYAGVSFWQERAGAPQGAPPPVQDGSFLISAAYLPVDFRAPLAVQSAAPGWLGLQCEQRLPQGGQVNATLLWSLEAMTALTPAAPLSLGNSLSVKPGLLSTDGRALSSARSPGIPPPAGPDGLVELPVVLASLGAGAAAAAPSVAYRLHVPQYRGRLLYALLDDGTLAAVGRRPDSYGVVRLQLCLPGGVAHDVQDIVNVVITFPACTAQGQTLAVLAQPGRIYLLDRATRRFELHSELDSLGQALFAGGQQLYGVALAEDFAIAAYASAPGLKLYGRDGSRRAISQIDPERSRADGSKRVVPLELLTAANRGGKWQRFAAKLAQEGRSAPVNVVTEAPQFAAVAPDCIAIVDRHYNRVVLVEYRPQPESSPERPVP